MTEALRTIADALDLIGHHVKELREPLGGGVHDEIDAAINRVRLAIQFAPGAPLTSTASQFVSDIALQEWVQKQPDWRELFRALITMHWLRNLADDARLAAHANSLIDGRDCIETLLRKLKEAREGKP